MNHTPSVSSVSSGSRRMFCKTKNRTDLIERVRRLGMMMWRKQGPLGFPRFISTVSCILNVVATSGLPGRSSYFARPSRSLRTARKNHIFHGPVELYRSRDGQESPASQAALSDSRSQGTIVVLNQPSTRQFKSCRKQYVDAAATRREAATISKSVPPKPTRNRWSDGHDGYDSFGNWRP